MAVDFIRQALAPFAAAATNIQPRKLPFETTQLYAVTVDGDLHPLIGANGRPLAVEDLYNAGIAVQLAGK